MARGRGFGFGGRGGAPSKVLCSDEDHHNWCFDWLTKECVIVVLSY